MHAIFMHFSSSKRSSIHYSWRSAVHNRNDLCWKTHHWHPGFYWSVCQRCQSSKQWLRFESATVIRHGRKAKGCDWGNIAKSKVSCCRETIVFLSINCSISKRDTFQMLKIGYFDNMISFKNEEFEASLGAVA